MGITGLIPFLKDASLDVHISDLKETVVVIDTYCWLHKALISVAYHIYKGNPVTAHVDYCVKRINELRKEKIKPIFVFDGRNLVAKEEVEKNRKKNREKAREELDQLYATGNTKEAWKKLPKCIDITQEIAFQLIEKLIELEIDYIVAPYEADAQIAYLLKNKFAHFAISEDSDLILFGCDYVFYKYNLDGNGVLICNDQILNCLGKDSSKFNFERFRKMCILSGCDYLPSLTGLGLQKSKKFFSLIKDDSDIKKCLFKIPSVLNMKKLSVSKEYVEKYVEAETTFKYQVVYCPKEKRLRPLIEDEASKNKDLYLYAGDYYDDKIALHFSLGNVDFESMQIINKKFLDKIQDIYLNNTNSIWNENYTLTNTKKIKKVLEKINKIKFVVPEVLNKRKHVDNENNITTPNKKVKKISPKKIEIIQSKKESYIENEEIIVGEDSNKEKIKESKKKIIVKSRFFSKKSDTTKSLDFALEKQKITREKIKALYSGQEKKRISSSQSSVDSGCYSNSQ